MKCNVEDTVVHNHPRIMSIKILLLYKLISVVVMSIEFGHLIICEYVSYIIILTFANTNTS